MCGSTVRNIHGIAIPESSEITELTGSNDVRTFEEKMELLVDTELV